MICNKLNNIIPTNINKTIHKQKRLSPGHYIYRGYKINCIGYYPPERKVVWEAVDHDGWGFAHSYSLRDTKRLIDLDLDKEIPPQKTD